MQLNRVQILGVRFAHLISGTTPVRIPRLAKPALALILIISVSACGSGEASSETTPTNPEPTQPSFHADLGRLDQDLAAPSNASQEIHGDLGNRTLLPGRYRAGQTLEISAGDLILDAQGNTDAVWVIQVMGELRVASARRVILSGGAQAGNVYWRVDTAQLGEYSQLSGNIVAQNSIHMLTGAYLEGRAWSLQGTVHLASSTIRTPAP